MGGPAGCGPAEFPKWDRIRTEWLHGSQCAGAYERAHDHPSPPVAAAININNITQHRNTRSFADLPRRCRGDHPGSLRAGEADGWQAPRPKGAGCRHLIQSSSLCVLLMAWHNLRWKSDLPDAAHCGQNRSDLQVPHTRKLLPRHWQLEQVRSLPNCFRTSARVTRSARRPHSTEPHSCDQSRERNIPRILHRASVS